MSVLGIALDPATVIVAVDPGKAFNRVWISDGTGLVADPMSLPVSREGISGLVLAIDGRARGDLVIAVEATGSLHRAWASELERRYPGRFGCLRPRRPKQREFSWDQAGLRPTTETVQR